MSYNSLVDNELLKDYISSRYNIDKSSFSTFLSLSAYLYYFEFTYNGIWYSICDKEPIIIQEHHRDVAYLLHGTVGTGLSKDEFFNQSLIHEVHEIVLNENILELTNFINNTIRNNIKEKMNEQLP